MFTINIYLKLALIAVCLVGGTVLAFAYGFWYALPFFIIGLGLLASYILLVFYRVFGIVANIALFMNVAMMIAVMSAIGAALSLPGIAGIVLTVGMAVDANVLIFERIREELRDGQSPQGAIIAG